MSELQDQNPDQQAEALSPVERAEHELALSEAKSQAVREVFTAVQKAHGDNDPATATVFDLSLEFDTRVEEAIQNLANAREDAAK